MGLNCGAKCAKYVLFVFNILFFLGGAAVLGVGIWIRVDSGSYIDFLQKVDPKGGSVQVTNNLLSENLGYIHSVAYALIGVGAFVFLVGFLGCCGAIKQWRPLLVVYAICLIIIMCAEVGVGIAVGVYKDKVLEAVNKELTPWAKKYGYRKTNLVDGRILALASPELDNNPDLAANTNGFNVLQVYFQCCGVSAGYSDFIDSPYWLEQRGIPPVFCCKMDDPAMLHLADASCYTNPSLANSNMNMGCVTRVTKFVEDNAPAVIGVAVGIGLIELVGIIFAFCLCCAIGGKERRYN